MISRNAAILLLFLSFVSCKKVFVKFRDAEISITDDASFLGIGNGYPNEVSEDFADNGIFRASSTAEYDSLIAFIEAGNSGYYPQINGVLPSEHFNGIDFTQHNLFAIFIQYDGQSSGEITRDKLKVKESTEEIAFNFKIKVSVGGASMLQRQKLIFFKVPIEQAHYSMSGKIRIDEIWGMGSNKDYTVNFSMP